MSKTERIIEGVLGQQIHEAIKDKATEPGEVAAPPPHYAGDGMQPFDIIDAYRLDFYEGNILKYLLRWRKKNGVQDLRKARHYLDELIDRAEDRL